MRNPTNITALPTNKGEKLLDITVIGFEEDTRFVDFIGVNFTKGEKPKSRKSRGSIKKAVDAYLSEQRPGAEVAAVVIGRHSDVYGE